MKEVVAVVVPFTDSNRGETVYVNPAYVMVLRPDPDNPGDASMIKVEGGECIKVRGAHRQVADRLGCTVPA
jgi:hypothetical protein